MQLHSDQAAVVRGTKMTTKGDRTCKKDNEAAAETACQYICPPGPQVDDASAKRLHTFAAGWSTRRPEGKKGTGVGGVGTGIDQERRRRRRRIRMASLRLAALRRTRNL
ncbi:hypothetical protein MTO96_014775 [Rhipicephalus appendiculatus]